MSQIWFYSIVSVIIVSLVSLVGVSTMVFREEKLKSWLLYLISFSAGALLGDVFLHIFPQLSGQGLGAREGAYVLGGILLFFILERSILWHHSHTEHTEEIHSVVYLTIIGDSLHNFMDGLVIAASFLVSIPLGIITTLAVVFHEIPHEFGNFAVLVHGGWKPKKALLYNLISSSSAILGAIVVLLLAGKFTATPTLLLSLGASSFIYIAMSDLIPEINKKMTDKKSATLLLFFVLGIGMMAALLLLE